METTRVYCIFRISVIFAGVGSTETPGIRWTAPATPAGYAETKEDVANHSIVQYDTITYNNKNKIQAKENVFRHFQGCGSKSSWFRLIFLPGSGSKRDKFKIIEKIGNNFNCTKMFKLK